MLPGCDRVRVQEDVARVGSAVERRWQKGLTQGTRAQVDGANPDVAKPRVILLVTIAPFRKATVEPASGRKPVRG